MEVGEEGDYIPIATLSLDGSDGQSHNTVSTNHNLFKEKEPKRYRTEVLPLTSLTPYR